MTANDVLLTHECMMAIKVGDHILFEEFVEMIDDDDRIDRLRRIHELYINGDEDVVAKINDYRYPECLL